MIRSRRFPLLAGAAALTVALVLWRALVAQERRELRGTIQSEAGFVKNRIAADMESRTLSLVRMASRWEIEGPPPAGEWDSYAASLVSRYRGYEAIEWVDASLRPRWITPPEGNGVYAGLDPGSEKQRRELFEAAKGRRDIFAVRSGDANGGRQVVLVCAPLFRGERFGGLLVGVFRVREWLDTLLEDVAPGYSIAVMDGGEPVYRRSGSATQREQAWSQEAAFQVHGLSWRVRVWPSPELLAGTRSALPRVVLISGLLMALLLAAAVHLAQTARLHQEELATTNQALKNEIDERQQAEEALRRSEANYRSLVQNAPVGIYRISQDGGRFVTVNRALVEMLGYDSEAELMGASLPGDVFRGPAEHQHFLEQCLDQERFDSVEAAWKRKDGTPITVLLAGRSLGNRRGLKDFEFIAEDVTERRALEQGLRQAQKMEAVGRLAGGVAHDFNNMLMVIQGSALLLRDCLGQSDPLRRNLQEILKAAERAASLTRQLLAFSRKQVRQPAVLNLNGIVAEAANLLSPLLGDNIELFLSLDPSLARVKADPGQLEQAIMNLAINARDAMADGGLLTIETKNVALDEAYARRHDSRHPGAYVMLAVSDTGLGMDEETRSHLFEPFFSTKPEGKGTGLGLATVYGIVEQNGGHIEVESEPGRGTSFKIYLPPAEEAAEAEAPPKTPAGSLQGSEIILLAEDDDGVRKLTREFLNIRGYTVLEARNGLEAIQISERHKGSIQLLLTDVLMPGMNGREVARSLAKARPETRVLYMSAYTRDAIANLDVLDHGTAFIEKPFTPDELARKVRQVLDDKREASASPSQAASN